MFCSTPSNTQCASSLARTTLLTLLHALVVTKVDYCSSVLSGISGQLLQRLQSVFNAAARLVFSVFSARKSEHITPLLCELHWLKVSERIQFRLCVLAYRCSSARRRQVIARRGDMPPPPIVAALRPRADGSAVLIALVAWRRRRAPRWPMRCAPRPSGTDRQTDGRTDGDIA